MPNARSTREAVGMVTLSELESLRRSQAMAPLPSSQVIAIIDACDQLVREREQVAAIVAGLPTTFSELRTALNELHRILR